ncbi:MAG: hypothetical protein CM15mP74_01720 [Halieaceae bacterium]|nr:MAG: hypothetical protein CM15mP74_01720 [Halieaceae bacterium]
MDALHDPFFFTITCTLLGLIVGSFLNVVILRLPKMMEQSWRRECSELLTQPVSTETPISLSHPNSHCPACGANIRAWQNIPVVSWLLLRGRCARCDTPISARYPFVELLTGTLTGLAAWQFGFGPEALSAFILIWILIALTGIDIDTQLLPDSMTLALLWVGLAVNLFDTWTSLPSAVMGAMLGYGSLWSVYWVFKLVTGKEGWATGFQVARRTGCLVRLADRSCDYPAVVFCRRFTRYQHSAPKASGTRYPHAIWPLLGRRRIGHSVLWRNLDDRVSAAGRPLTCCVSASLAESVAARPR